MIWSYSWNTAPDSWFDIIAQHIAQHGTKQALTQFHQRPPFIRSLSPSLSLSLSHSDFFSFVNSSSFSRARRLRLLSIPLRFLVYACFCIGNPPPTEAGGGHTFGGRLILGYFCRAFVGGLPSLGRWRLGEVAADGGVGLERDQAHATLVSLSCALLEGRRGGDSTCWAASKL
jgi:hypothetical protein